MEALHRTNTLKLYTQYTAAHEVLFREFFQPSIPAGIELIVETPQLMGAGDYYSSEWHSCILRKVAILIEAVESNEGAEIIWADVDIEFFAFEPGKLLAMLLESGRDILFQRERRRGEDEVNTGFFICRCNASTLGFFRRVAEVMAAEQNPNDQITINRLLPGSTDVSWGFLPAEYYARTHGFPPPRRPVLYHANYTTASPSVPLKCKQLAEMRRMVNGGTGMYLAGVAREARRQGLGIVTRAIWRRLMG